MILQERPDPAQVVPVRVRSTKNTAWGLPMFTTPGECSTGSSIGPICNSMRRVSGKGSASGISSQARCGRPMSTVKDRSELRRTPTRPALVSSSRRLPSAGRAMAGSSSIA